MLRMVATKTTLRVPLPGIVEARDHQWLRVNLAIHHHREESAECLIFQRGRGEKLFIENGAGAREVVVVRQDIGSGRDAGSRQQQSHNSHPDSLASAEYHGPPLAIMTLLLPVPIGAFFVPYLSSDSLRGQVGGINFSTRQGDRIMNLRKVAACCFLTAAVRRHKRRAGPHSSSRWIAPG